MTTTCIAPTNPPCPNPGTRKGLCNGHYKRMQDGRPLDTPIRLYGAEHTETRYRQRVDEHGPDECWPWTGRLNPDGYGVIDRTPTGQLAHRYGWFLAHGPIPDGAVIDHACHDPAACPSGPTCPHRACQNPAHMSLSTPAENGAEGRRRMRNSDKTHCPVGHPYDEANTRWQAQPGRRPYRVCRACARERYHARKGHTS